MSQDFDPNRRTLSVGAALALLVFLLISIGGCGGGGGTPAGPSSPNPTPTPSLGPGDIAGFVAANHADPHIAVIRAAQLSAGLGLILDIPNGFHSHTVTLTGAQVMLIAGRATVSVRLSTDPHSGGNDPHSHMVTFN